MNTHIRSGALLLSIILSIAACTLQEAKTASGIVSSVASDAPAACAIINVATGNKLGTACSPIASDVSDVAKLVQDIIASIPSGMKAATAPSAMVAIRVKAPSGGMVDLTMPEDVAAMVQAKLGK